MLTCKRLAVITAVLAFSLPALADRASTAFKHGAQEQKRGNYDAAFAYYKQAYTLKPDNPKYFTAYTRTRFQASTQHVRSGQMLRNAGALTESLAEFQKAAEIDSTNFMAQQEMRRTADMVRRQERQRAAPKVESPLAKATAELDEPVELQPISNSTITLRMAVNSDVAYKTICKLAGINVLIDPEYRPQKITVELNDVTLRDALDMVRLQSKTYWRAVSANTIYVTSDSPGKRKELEPNVMKTFYLKNITTPNELQEAANVVRQVLDINRVQLLQGQDALILRGNPDQMVLAEKLIADIDKPKSEVVITVAVMQVSRDRIRNMGTVVPTSASIGFVNPGGSTGSGNNGSGGNSSGGYTFRAGTFVLSVPGASFTALASDSNTKLLQNPEIRALNNEKATLRIGDRVPIATGSFQPGLIGGGGVSPLVSTQFQYLDVGVNIDITPHIHSNSEVTLKMSLEISSVTGSQNIGGITQPIIGQRRIEQETRLADGDVNLLGGILEESETQSLSGYPWVSKIPILKYLFAQENKERRENEIVFAITPHIVRGQELTDENLRMVSVGTGNTIEVRRKAPVAPAAVADRPADSAKPGDSTPQTPPANAPSTTQPRPGTPSQAGSQGKTGGF